LDERARESDVSDSLAELKRILADEPQIEYVDAVFFDLCGYPRGKRYRAAEASKIFTDGVLVPRPTYVLDVRGMSLDPMGYGFIDGDPDAPLRPIGGTLASTSWSGGKVAQVLVSLEEHDDGGMLFDPRNILARVLRRFSELDLMPVVAFELEFYLIESKCDSEGRPVPARLAGRGLEAGRRDNGQLYCLDRLDGHESLFPDIMETCERMQVPTTVVMSEFARGQFEITFEHISDPLRAADHCSLFRQIVKRVAARHGCDATFLGKPFPDQTGNGMHIHMSLLDRDGQNVFADATPEGSKQLSQAIAGLLAVQFDSTAVYAPNINSYRRYTAKACVPITRTWAVNNRSVAVRIPAGHVQNRRFEHRAACADANPYLVLATVLAGVHHGIVNQLDPGAPSFGNACQEVDPDFPGEWLEAIGRFRESALLKEYLGEDYVETYAEAKRLERVSYLEQVPKEEFEWYL
jgi:glutamine synthetase